MELKELIEKCTEAINDAVQCSEPNAENYGAKVDTGDGTIDLFYFEHDGEWTMEATIYHDKDYMRETHNLETFIEERVEVDWDAAEEAWRDYDMDEYQRNGFASEADFWRWKEGRL